MVDIPPNEWYIITKIRRYPTGYEWKRRKKMAQARAKCTCKECGAEFIRTATKRNRAEADSWEEWAKSTFDLCNECYKKACDEAALKEPLTLNIRIEPFRTDEPIVLAFSGCSKKYKDQIKELGYFWRENTSGLKGILDMNPEFCWQKNIKIEVLDEEVKKAKEICNGDEFVVKNGISDIDMMAYKAATQKRDENKAHLQEELDAITKPERPECIPEGKWNGKVYGGEKYGYSIYVDGEKHNISIEDKKEIESYAKARDEYHEKREAVKAKYSL